MFGHKQIHRENEVATTATAAIITTNRPTPAPVINVPLDDNEVRAYSRTAEAIGFESAALLHARLLAVLAARSIPVYDYAAVAQYLTHHVELTLGSVGSWWWRPLRAADVETRITWGITRWSGDQIVARDYYRAGAWDCRVYHRAVPLRVLARVEQIYMEFTDRLKFFVTDLGMWDREQGLSRPDPFICVTALDVPRIIFDAWDEPGFFG